MSYVDFQDGASQLQFCSDKCLNQYKMQLFCKETQAHLDMNPHLKEKGIDKHDALITPELWLKNCRSRSGSPTSSLSSRNTPQLNRNDLQTDKPLITVTNIQKLLDDSNHYPPPVNKRKLMKSRKRRIRLPINESCLPVPEHQHYNSEPIRPPTLNAHQGSQPNFNIMPPITVMVPYPVIIPLPIPVPIPIWDIHKAYSENMAKKASSSSTSSSSGSSSKPVPAESEETELERQSIMKPKDFPNNNNEKEVEENEDLVEAVAEERQMIPKLKITRLQSRRITESSRPLRKRKLVNSEYMRVLSSTKNTETNDIRK